MNLSASEIRVLGTLMEKQRTTPDVYPLSLNSLRLACNQSTNRDPIVDYDDGDLRDALQRLQRRGFARLASGVSSRSPKFRHLLAEALPMNDAEHAVMCVLMLRGAQTPGELKQRTDRMHSFADLAAVHGTLDELIGRELVVCQPRRPGQKEDRYNHLLSDNESPESAAEPISAAPNTPPSSESSAIATLTERVAALEHELAQLRAEISHPIGGQSDE
jgi:uncharacterized protein YceH (UPF0502 family)